MQDDLIVLADFENEMEYRQIKAVTAFKSLKEHRQALMQAKGNYELKGFKVALETCDLKGYKEFLKKNNIQNTPQNVAGYVVAKFTKNLDKDFSELKHQNIEIIED